MMRKYRELGLLGLLLCIVALASALTGSPRREGRVDWRKPFAVNGVQLDAGIGEVVLLKGHPLQSYETYAYWPDFNLGLKDGRTTVVTGTHLSQDGQLICRRGDSVAWLLERLGEPNGKSQSSDKTYVRLHYERWTDMITAVRLDSGRLEWITITWWKAQWGGTNRTKPPPHAGLYEWKPPQTP